MSDEIIETTSTQVGTSEPANESSYDSVDDIVSALDKQFATEQQTEDGTQDATLGNDDVQAQQVQPQNETEQVPPEQQSLPTPEGWADEVFNALPSNVKDTIRQREEAHAQDISKAIQYITKSKEAHDQFAVAANREINQALGVMKRVIEGEFNGIDWNAIKEKDPAQYIQLRDAFQQRVDAVKGVQQRVNQLAQAYEQHVQAEAQKSIQREALAVIPIVKTMYGNGFTPQKFGKEIATYLAQNGVPAQAINGMSKGYELILATKAMMWDRQQQNMATARQKIAQAPQVMTPKNMAVADNGRSTRLNAAMANLRKNPNSTDAIADVFATL